MIVTDLVFTAISVRNFYAEPLPAGDRVTLEISLRSTRPATPATAAPNTQRVSTTVSAAPRMDRTGGSGQQSSGRDRGNLSVGTSDVRDKPQHLA